VAAKASTRKAAKKSARKSSVGKKKLRTYDGPAEWIMPMMEEVYSRLEPKPRDDTPAIGRSAPARKKAKAAKGKARKQFVSVYQEGKGESVLADLPRDYWADTLKEYHKRRKESPGRLRGLVSRLTSPVRAAMPVIPGQNNWTPLGPGVVEHAQTNNRAAISGRISGIAVAPGGLRMYVASANGGVWRSDDAGRRWRSTMDSFDQDPSNFASASLVCGAIAIDFANPDRIYVGTGEGETDAIFSSRITGALPAYRGIGPVRSDDGGASWVLESSSPSLAGFAFFQIAVDPGDPEHCVAATTNGLYERTSAASGWTRRRTGSHSSVVVARVGTTTTWFGAVFGGAVFTSTNGNTWASVGTGFPAGAGRVALGMQRDNANIVYAVIANTNGALNSVRRLDGGTGAWKNVASPPDFLPVDANGNSQGDYDLCIAVDPNNANRIYLGGSYFNGGNFPGSIWRCDVSPSGTAYTIASASIGQNAHADVHVLVHTPADSNILWTGTDGGLFVNFNPSGATGFEARNTGLHTLCVTFIAQHPTEPAVAYIGLQDNGSAKYTGEQVWRNVLYGDGGYCVVNWNSPFHVLLYANGAVYRATDGGLDWTSWSAITPSGSQWVMMAAPLVGAPYNPGTPAEADVVAYGAGSVSGSVFSAIVYISSDFGTTWPAANRITLPSGSGGIFSMSFASATRLYVGTTNGRVFRLDKGATWSMTRIDNVAAGALPLAGLVTDIAVDASDATGSSIFISFGGTGDFRHVWRFDGTSWQARSGTSGSSTQLLDVEHNALQYDRVTNRVYVGTDVSVWQTTDGGLTWTPLENGLPDSPVYDLQIHPTARLMRAALHGRGVWEWKLDAPILPDVELYIRDTKLDTGRGVNTDGRDDPSIFPTAQVVHYQSPNIKVDVPTPAGYQTTNTDIDFLTFNTVIQDGSNGVGTNVPPPTVHNRVYVEVHNRGRVDATNVQVYAAITNAATGLGLPAGYTANVVAGTPLPGTKWITLTPVVIPVVHAGFPEIAYFDLPSTVLPMPASLPGNSHWCMATFFTCAQDPFTNTITNVDALTLADRKVGQRNLHIVEFIGTPPAPATGIGMWIRLVVSGVHFKSKGLTDLVIDSRRFNGTLYALLPAPIFPAKATQMKGVKPGPASIARQWLAQYPALAKKLYFEAKFSDGQYKQLTDAMSKVSAATPLVFAAGGGQLTSIPINPKDEHSIFLRIDLPKGTKVGTVYEFDVTQRDTKSGKLLGGSRYRVMVNRKK
jgi:hypothetical protein